MKLRENAILVNKNKEIMLLYGSAFLFLLIAPLFIKNAFVIRLMTTTFIYSVVCFGNMLICGYRGMMCLGFAAFYGIGAYVAALLAKNAGMPFGVCLLCAGIVSAIIGFVICLPCLRLTVDFVGLITTAFLNIFLAIVRNWNSVTNGATGISAIPRPVIFGKKISSGMDFYYLTFIVMVIAFSLLNNVIHSKIGRNLQGIRDNELGAISVGVKAKRLKLFAFTVGTFFAGVAGCLYAFYISAINPNNFVFNISTQIMQMCILGGLGSLPGAVIGAAFFTMVPELYRDLALYRIGIGGLIMVLCMLFRPQGLLGSRAFAGDKGIADRIKQLRILRKNA